ncbi:30S ribosomal protein S20 [bacterium]|nr:30S ribosomal protein S20 [bacterium]
MPTHKSNWKRLRQDKVRRVRNIARKSQIRTQVNRVKNALAAGTARPEVEGELRATISLLDRAAKSGVIHRRKADRKKSRLARMVARSASTASES